jgi:hypothetical protein
MTIESQTPSEQRAAMNKHELGICECMPGNEQA